MKSLKIRPYARLLTMLGDQLIRNETIALIELIKNSYDADASFVKISLEKFGDNLKKTKESAIVIEDDGNGMDGSIIENAWLNPATPIKYLEKKRKSTTDKGRIIQGEKGIGRFAIIKLGRRIEIITRRQSTDKNGHFLDSAEETEYVLTYDFSMYSDDFMLEESKGKELFLDDISVSLFERKPIDIVKGKIALGAQIRERKPYGTIIRISDLKTDLSKKKIESVIDTVSRMQPISFDNSSEEKESVESSFRTYFYLNNKSIYEAEDTDNKIRRLLSEKYVFRFKGKFLAKDSCYRFMVDTNNGTGDRPERKLGFSDAELSGMRAFRKYFEESGLRNLECGDFNFDYFIFDLDLSGQDNMRYVLEKDEKETIKSHRIYLYRDGIRVMPYGDKDFDWLNIDVMRGTESVSHFFSNDQTVGFVYITQKGNPNLKDKTNREGLLDSDNAYQDFVFANQLILRYFRSHEYTRYLISKKGRIQKELETKGKPLEIIEGVRKEYKDDSKILMHLSNIEKAYARDLEIRKERIEKTENLAAVGLASQTGSHDARSEIVKARDKLSTLLEEIKKGSGEIDNEFIIDNLKLIYKLISSANKRMTSLQKLFPSTRSWRKDINVAQTIKEVYQLVKESLDNDGIKVRIAGDKMPLIARTTPASLLQVFINLFDNSAYWLLSYQQPRIIEIRIDSENNKVIFSDNGPGIREEDKPYIFDAFFSGKGESGSGLGLYISKQLMNRYGFSITANDKDEDSILGGADFILDFSGGKVDEF